MVFQSYALFPHLSVFENVAYGLRVRWACLALTYRDVLQRRSAWFSWMAMARAESDSSQAGNSRRVALARAMVIEPAVLLMDEPLGALDRQLRKHVQLEIRRLHRKLGRTTLYVTHDQEEA